MSWPTLHFWNILVTELLGVSRNLKVSQIKSKIHREEDYGFYNWFTSNSIRQQVELQMLVVQNTHTF